MNFVSRFLIGTLGGAAGAIISQVIDQLLSFSQFNYIATAAFTVLLGPIYGLIFATTHKLPTGSILSCILCGLGATAILTGAVWFADSPDKLPMQSSSATFLALAALSMLTGLSTFLFTRNAR